MVTEGALAGAWNRLVEGQSLWLGHGDDGYWALVLGSVSGFFLWWGRGRDT